MMILTDRVLLILFWSKESRLCNTLRRTYILLLTSSLVLKNTVWIVCVLIKVIIISSCVHSHFLWSELVWILRTTSQHSVTYTVGFGSLSFYVYLLLRQLVLFFLFSFYLIFELQNSCKFEFLPWTDVHYNIYILFIFK